MIDNALLFILSFLGLIAIGALVVGGWFFVTRGELVTLPDGQIKKEGKIFRNWFLFWTRERPEKKAIFYRGLQLEDLVKDIKSHFIRMDNGDRVCDIKVHDAAVSIFGAKRYEEIGTIKHLCEELDIKFWDKGDGYFSIYKEYPVFVYPEWVRHPLATCATCFSSVYGSLFYWISMPFVGKHLYSWMQMPILASLFFWVIFCLSLAIPLTALAKKYN